MKKWCYTAVFTWLFLLLTACRGDLPEPETKKYAIEGEAAVETSGLMMEAAETFTVKHQVKGNDLYLECMVRGASFRNNGAKMILYIDGKKTKEIANAAFIVKGLNKGEHKIKLELMFAQQGVVAVKEIDIEIK